LFKYLYLFQAILGATIEVPSFTGSVMLKVSIAITIVHNNTLRHSFNNKKHTHLDTLSNSLTLLSAKTRGFYKFIWVSFPILWDIFKMVGCIWILSNNRKNYGNNVLLLPLLYIVLFLLACLVSSEVWMMSFVGRFTQVPNLVRRWLWKGRV
jgi:hypothetical protein